MKSNPGRAWHHQQLKHWNKEWKKAKKKYKKNKTEENFGAMKFLEGLVKSEALGARMSALAYKEPAKYWRIMTFRGRVGGVPGRVAKGKLTKREQAMDRFEHGFKTKKQAMKYAGNPKGRWYAIITLEGNRYHGYVRQEEPPKNDQRVIAVHGPFSAKEYAEAAVRRELE